MSIIQKLLDEKCGFVTDADMPEVIKENRLQQVLVRCGSGRFICPAQDAQHFIDIIERDAKAIESKWSQLVANAGMVLTSRHPSGEYIRDVSIYRP
jgi:hypothetical protein